MYATLFTLGRSCFIASFLIHSRKTSERSPSWQLACETARAVAHSPRRPPSSWDSRSEEVALLTWTTAEGRCLFYTASRTRSSANEIRDTPRREEARGPRRKKTTVSGALGRNRQVSQFLPRYSMRNLRILKSWSLDHMKRLLHMPYSYLIVGRDVHAYSCLGFRNYYVKTNGR